MCEKKQLRRYSRQRTIKKREKSRLAFSRHNGAAFILHIRNRRYPAELNGGIVHSKKEPPAMSIYRPMHEYRIKRANTIYP